MKFIKNTIRVITLCFLNIITSMICTIIIAMLCFIIQKIGFVENINYKHPFWVVFLLTHFLLYCFLSNYWLDRWRKTPEIDDKDLNAYSKKDLGTLPEIDDTDLNAYSKKDLCWSIDSIKHKKEIKQFCYDSSNPCHYCDTKFEHTALHCAIYFSDIERLQEVIELIKKVDGVDSYGVSDFYYSMCGKIFNSKHLTSQGLIPLALSIGNIKIIKFLFQIVTTKGSEKLKIYVGNNQSIDINPHDEESINRAIDYFKYKKKTKTGKGILDKHQE